jgi:hypothetical protein
MNREDVFREMERIKSTEGYKKEQKKYEGKLRKLRLPVDPKTVKPKDRENAGRGRRLRPRLRT